MTTTMRITATNRSLSPGGHARHLTMRRIGSRGSRL